MIQVMILVTNLVKLYDHVHKNPLQLCHISASTFSARLCSTLFQSYHLNVRVIERWAKSPSMSFVLNTTQRWSTWRLWHTCCSVCHKRCLQLVVGSQCWFVCRHFPCCRDAEMADLSLLKKSLHDSLSDAID